MNGRRVELALWAVAGILLLTAAVGVRNAAMDDTGAAAAESPTAPRRSDRPAPSEELSASIAQHDPFRVERHPSPIPYKAELEGIAPPQPPPKPPKPVLVLAGILGGPPWEALIEGIPGHEGSTLVREGETYAALKVRVIRRDSVIIQGADTTWRLGLKRNWQ